MFGAYCENDAINFLPGRVGDHLNLIVPFFIFLLQLHLKTVFNFRQATEDITEQPQFPAEIFRQIPVGLFFVRDVPPENIIIGDDDFVAGLFLVQLQKMRGFEMNDAGGPGPLWSGRPACSWNGS